MCSSVLYWIADITPEAFWDAISAFLSWCLATHRLERRKLERRSELSELSGSILEVPFVVSLGIGNNNGFLIAPSPS